MKGSHLTLRLPAELVRALTRRAKESGVARSHVVREAVAVYLGGVRPPRAAGVTAAELAKRWPGIPRLTADEAADLSADLAAARAEVPPPAWE